MLHLECSKRLKIMISITFPRANATIAHSLFTLRHYSNHELVRVARIDELVNPETLNRNHNLDSSHSKKVLMHSRIRDAKESQNTLQTLTTIKYRKTLNLS